MEVAGLYKYLLVHRSKDERTDCTLKGKIQSYEELVGLTTQLKKDIEKRAEEVK